MKRKRFTRYALMSVRGVTALCVSWFICVYKCNKKDQERQQEQREKETKFKRNS